MMSSSEGVLTDNILTDGDRVIFSPSFGIATVVVKPGTIRGSGPAKIDGKKICVDGDEKDVQVPGCSYISGPYSVPGTGTLKISKLASNQITRESKTGGKAILLKGGDFTAKFEVQSPAKMPPNANTPDPSPEYSGSGSFVASNIITKGT